MKSSAVAMSFKALASRIHGQLPLSPKESQRLLTALTTSFREHLDEAHPSTAEDRTPHTKHSKPSVPKHAKPSILSSASYADQHMSNVLTMFGHKATPPPQDQQLKAAKAELSQGADPLALLEAYEEAGTASIPIATLCLQTVQQSFAFKPYAEQAGASQEKRAGSRALAWLWRSRRHQSTEFVENRAFMTSLTRLLMLENQTAFLWDWLDLDMKLGSQTPPSFADIHRQAAWEYRWKGRLVQAMIHVALTPPQSDEACADIALSVFLRVAELRAAAFTDGSSFKHVKLAAPLTAIIRHFQTPGRHLDNTSPELYRALLTHVSSSMKHHNPASDFHRAALELLSPHDPSPSAALALLQKCLSNDAQDVVYSRAFRLDFRGDVKVPLTLSPRLENFLAATAGSLQASGRGEDATWVRRKLLEESSKGRENVHELLEKWRQHFVEVKARTRREARAERVEEGAGVPLNWRAAWV